MSDLSAGSPTPSPLRTEDFNFELPEASIAQRPAPRGSSRLLVLDAEDAARHRRVRDLPEILRAGDLLVVNDTRVLPARLEAHRRPGGGRCELLLLEKLEARTWSCLARPAKRLRVGTVLDLAPDLEAEVLAIDRETRVLRFSEDVEPRLDTLGHVPLPPYIRRPDDAEDRTRYQTVFARHDGAVAAPTAGLHFDDALLERLIERGVDRTAVTLHVGPGTFRPVTAERVQDHRMDTERWIVPPEAEAAIDAARARGGRIVAVGTTVVRTLESAARDDGRVPSGSGRTDLFLMPGSRLRAVDVLLTNFHLPRSTLLMLVSAFAGRERVLAAYREAVERGYRFYSYGDAMLLERRR